MYDPMRAAGGAPKAEAAGIVWDSYRRCCWLVRAVSNAPYVSIAVTRLTEDSRVSARTKLGKAFPTVEGGGSNGGWLIGAREVPSGNVEMHGDSIGAVRRCSVIADETGLLVHCDLGDGMKTPLYLRVDDAGKAVGRVAMPSPPK